MKKYTRTIKNSPKTGKVKLGAARKAAKKAGRKLAAKKAAKRAPPNATRKRK